MAAKGSYSNSFKVNKSVHIAKSRQQFNITLKNLFVARAKHALKEFHLLNHGIKYNTNSSHYSSSGMLIDLINSVTEISLQLPLIFFYKDKLCKNKKAGFGKKNKSRLKIF